MGTRNLTVVIYKNQVKVAQYGQWDGYPQGQGLKVLKFLKKEDLEQFKHKLDHTRWLNDEQAKSAELMAQKEFSIKYPLLDRDLGAEVLGRILNSRNSIIYLQNNIEFAQDSLFCEWAYVIDLDQMKLEVYEGFNQTIPAQPGDRFYLQMSPPSPERNEKYYPVRLTQVFDINDLPSESDFITICLPDEIEET